MSGAITTTASSADNASAAASNAKERALLAKLLRTYQADIDKGQSAESLKALAKQIKDTAKLLGQNVSLPQAASSSTSSVSSAPAPAAETSDASKVDIKA